MSKVFGGAGTQPTEEKEDHSQSYTGEPFMSTSPAGVPGDRPLGTRNCQPRSPLPSVPFLHAAVTFYNGNISVKGNYKDGVKDGEWVSYDPETTW